MEVPKHVRTAIAPYLDMIRDCILSAWQEYQDNCRNSASVFSAWTKAGALRDYIVEYAHRTFAADRNVRVHKKRGMILFVIGGNPEISLRFKKLNKKLLSSNSRTLQALSYSNQLPIPGLLPQTVHLNAGYQLDETSTGIECYITCPSGEKSIAWNIHIPSQIEEQPTISIPQEELTVAPKRVHLKTNTNKKKAQ